MRSIKSISIFRATLVVIAIMSFTSVQAQLGTIASGLADKRRQKKIEKSPARDHILAVEKNLPILKKETGKYTKPAEYLPKDDKDFERFNTPFQSINENLPLILKKDPKWDVSEYKSQFSALEPIFKSIETGYGKRQRAVVLADSIYNSFPNPRPIYDNYFRFGYSKECGALYKNLNTYNLACDCGEKHHSFYIEKLRIKELRVILEEISPIMDYLPFYYSSAKESRVKRLKIDYFDKYDKLQDFWLSSAAKAIESSKESDNDFQSIGVLNYYVQVMETALEISDQKSSDFKTRRTELNDRIKTIQKERLIENKITDENKGKIYFLASDVSRADFSEDQAINVWNLEKPIHFRWFMASTPQEMHLGLNNAVSGLDANQDAHMTHVIYIDGKKIFQGIYKGFGNMPELYANALTMRGTYDGEEDGIHSGLAQKILQEVSIGTHKMKVEAYMDGRKAEMAAKPFAVGEISLKVTATAFSKFKINPEICFPKTGMHNASVSQQIKALVKEEFKKNAVSVRIIDKDWIVNRNKYSGIILSRGVNATVLFNDGTCRKMEVWARQKHNGGGQYAPITIEGYSDTEEIPCNCLR